MTSGPRRAAAVAGTVVALAAGAATGLVVADLQPVPTATVPAAQASPALATPAAEAPQDDVTGPLAPTLQPAPPPQPVPATAQPHTATRSS